MTAPPPAPRLVLDTNVVIAGLLWNGPPRRLIEAALAGRVELATSELLLNELTRSLGYPKFAKRLAAFATTAAGLAQQYAAIASIAPAATIRPAVQADRDDDEVLACALAAAADLVVSGDADLLNLKQFHGIRIVRPADALATVAA